MEHEIKYVSFVRTNKQTNKQTTGSSGKKTTQYKEHVRKNLAYFRGTFLRLIYIIITKPNHIQSR